MQFTSKKNTKPIQDFAKLLQRNLPQALDAATIELQELIRSNAPVDSGAFKASISVKLSRTSDMFKNTSTVLAINPSLKLSSTPIEFGLYHNSVFSFVPYAKVLETGSNGRSGKFIFSRSIQTFKPRFKAIIIEHLKRG
jgi:hypothetical protein